MYRTTDNHQISLFDFNQSLGTPLDETNEWVVYAREIDWKGMEAEYAAMFHSHRGRPATPFRSVLGALILKAHLGLSDRALIKAIAQDPCLQYFIGMNRYESLAPFSAGALSTFRRRFDREYLRRINEQLPEGLSVPEEFAGAEAPECDGDAENISSEEAENIRKEDEESIPAGGAKDIPTEDIGSIADEDAGNLVIEDEGNLAAGDVESLADVNAESLVDVNTGNIIDGSTESIRAEKDVVSHADIVRRLEHAKVGLVFTTHGDALVKEVKRCVRAELEDDIEILCLGDASILEETVTAGKVTAQAASRLVRMYVDAVDAGCDAILNVCSSVGEVADAMQEFAGITGVPIVRIDEEMCRRAVREDGADHTALTSAQEPPGVSEDAVRAPEFNNDAAASAKADAAADAGNSSGTDDEAKEAAARPLRIAVMATLSSTLQPTGRLLQRCADEAGRRIERIDILVDNAFGLEPDALCARLAEAAREHAADCDVIVLSQGSMSLCEEAIRQATGRPVYSSPRTGARALHRALLRRLNPGG